MLEKEKEEVKKHNFNTDISVSPDREDRPEVQLVGEDGNAWAIMGACKKKLEGE